MSLLAIVISLALLMALATAIAMVGRDLRHEASRGLPPSQSDSRSEPRPERPKSSGPISGAAPKTPGIAATVVPTKLTGLPATDAIDPGVGPQ
ncbi:MAG: hypothetical protein WC718_11975 [Phycisphaerales bacterium]